MDKILSIAVPAYNAEHYLDKCLSSMLSKDVLDKLDIIVVNDGSTDSTASIAENYVSKWAGSFTVIHKENGGHGSGINAATKVARGKYFRVVDADDWLLSEHLPRHIAELEHCNEDVVINSFHRVDWKNGKRHRVEVPQLLHKQTLSMEQLIDIFHKVRNCFTIHGISYRLETYMNAQTILSENVFYEDNEFTVLPFCNVKNIYFSPFFLYQYSVGNQMQSVSDSNQVLRISHLGHVLWRICDFYRCRNDLSKPVRSYIGEKLSVVVFSYLTTCLLRNPDRNEGSQKAEFLMQQLNIKCPDIWEQVYPKYSLLLKMHHYHVSGKLFDHVLESNFYRILRDLMRK